MRSAVVPAARSSRRCIACKLNREIAIKGEYRYDQLCSNIDGVDCSANVFLVALKLQR